MGVTTDLEKRRKQVEEDSEKYEDEWSEDDV